MSAPDRTNGRPLARRWHGWRVTDAASRGGREHRRSGVGPGLQLSDATEDLPAQERAGVDALRRGRRRVLDHRAQHRHDGGSLLSLADGGAIWGPRGALAGSAERPLSDVPGTLERIAVGGQVRLRPVVTRPAPFRMAERESTTARGPFCRIDDRRQNGVL